MRYLAGLLLRSYARTIIRGCCCILLLAPLGLAQRYKLTFVHGSKAGEQIELIQHEISPQFKISMIERFIDHNPGHEAGSYYLEWIQTYMSRVKDAAGVLKYGEMLLALHPDDMDAIVRCQRAAEWKQDPVLIAKWEDRAAAAAERIVRAPQPKDLSTEVWTQDLALARGILDQKEYESFTKAIQAASGRPRVVALEAFLTQYPKSKYEPQALPHLMNGYRALGDPAKVVALGERILAVSPNDLDALLLTSQILLDRRQNLPKVIANGNRVLQLVAGMAKPENQSAQDWEKRRNYYLGSAHLLIGNAHVNGNNFVQADKSLRAALTFQKGVEQTEAAILFYLGWANYHLEHYKEAAAFFTQCKTFAGPFAEQANRNLLALQRERRIP